MVARYDTVIFFADQLVETQRISEQFIIPLKSGLLVKALGGIVNQRIQNADMVAENRALRIFEQRKHADFVPLPIEAVEDIRK